jgi:hypothetical protein
VIPLFSGGLPHSEIRGSTGARPSPRLFAACHVLHRLSVPRHPPDALHVLRPRPAPSTRPSRVQRSDVRGQMSEGFAPGHAAAARLFLISDLRSLTSELCASTAPPMLAHRPRIPMPRPDLTSRDDGRTCFTVTTRFTISREQRTEDRRPTRRSAARTSVTTRGSRHQKTRQKTFLSSVICPLSSEPGGPGPI